MDLRRIKKNIQSRKWESKSMKTNIDYIKKQLKQFGLSAPKYLTTNKKLTQNQIQNQSKRILKEIERIQDVARIETSKPSMNKAMKNLKKAINKHNKLVANQMLWLQKQNISDKRRDYILGEQIQINDYWDINTKHYIDYTDTPFKVYNPDRLYFDSIESVNNMIKRINSKDKQLTHANINKILKNNNDVIKDLRDVLKGYTDAGNILESESAALLNEIKKLDGIQQKAFFTIWRESAPKSKYMVADDEIETLNSNIVNKWDKILKQARKV